ncbi:MAG: TIGR04211 family SH3 domain-containing protein [Gammaproteobacteria bacterium]|nr:TIGR04211 family SH3 domain-containing protein [Gammaproteobacteria bacterium]MDH4253685.1 TIGR04211 family SH3 domain-containing protein [Gammaproteobacteria bacterium]MDH5310670.1 TIGR04211 family SH3 domain-containing protein [Gammaproteobacteria bacterium]MDH5502066.1 TIGR04211 family SH3 domain-containing protein [Gammaproteobacteria bacterium]
MRLTIWLLFVAAPITAFAETAYVTDNLRLGLHQAEDTSDRAFQTLESGQELEVLSRNRNYAQVRLPDGTLGYVKVAYLVDEKPAKLIVTQTQAANEDLQRRLAELNAAFSQPAATIEKLESEVSEARAALDAATARVAALEDDNESLRRGQDQYKFSLPINWVAGALAFCLLAGFLGGLWWTDYRSRQRHGGIRIY